MMQLHKAVGPPFAGSLKLRICTVLKACPGSTSESGVAMMVISATVVWKLDSSLHVQHAEHSLLHADCRNNDSVATYAVLMKARCHRLFHPFFHMLYT